MSEYKLTQTIERYLNGEMDATERTAFEQLCRDNADVASQFEQHKNFLAVLKQYGERVELESRLNAIHDEIDVHTLKEELLIQPTWIVRMWRQHHSKISVAASIAIFAVLVTLLFTGKFKGDNSSYVKLSAEVASVKRSTDQLKQKSTTLQHQINSVRSVPTNPGNFRGTSFALTSNGYLVTNYHVVRNADSIYVQNADGESFHASVIYSEPAEDIAILAIRDSAFKTLSSIPYNIRKAKSDLGEEVFTVGYPSDALSFSPGAVTSSVGFNGDSTAYEVSIAARPGNSGGPLLDSKGNLVGIISGKQSHYEGLSFAKKSSYLLKAIKAIPADSLTKPLTLSSKTSLMGMSRAQQVEKVKKYIFMVKVY